MELVFPFKNIIINGLRHFFGKEKVKQFNSFKTGKESWNEEFFFNDIEQWRDYLPNFENEILQIIYTTDQKTIDTFFTELGENLSDFKDSLNKEYFEENIALWNDEILNDYNKLVEKESEQYANHENRKRKHLEEYEDWNHGSFLFRRAGLEPKKVKKINYNFYCIDKTPDLIDHGIIDEYLSTISPLFKDLVDVSIKYGKPWHEGEIKSKVEEQFIPKPILFVEGDHDITYIEKAAEHLKKGELLDKIELRQRGGCRNLDKLWKILNEESWESVPQIKIFLYDCDTNRKNEDFGNHYMRIIPTNTGSIVKKGIENLFNNDLIKMAINEKRAFVDFYKISGIKRGIEYEEEYCEINKDEKKNFCDWVCKNGTEDDFESFNVIFEIIEELI